MPQPGQRPSPKVNPRQCRGPKRLKSRWEGLSTIILSVALPNEESVQIPWNVMRDPDQPGCTTGSPPMVYRRLLAPRLIPARQNACLLLLPVGPVTIPVVSGIIQVGLRGHLDCDARIVNGMESAIAFPSLSV